MSSCFIVVNLIALRSPVGLPFADVVDETIGENDDDRTVLRQEPQAKTRP